MSQVLEYPQMGLLQGLLHICRHGWHVASIKTGQIGLILQLVAVRLLLNIYIYLSTTWGARSIAKLVYNYNK